MQTSNSNIQKNHVLLNVSLTVQEHGNVITLNCLVSIMFLLFDVGIGLCSITSIASKKIKLIRAPIVFLLLAISIA